jgi:hypothetical protein
MRERSEAYLPNNARGSRRNWSTRQSLSLPFRARHPASMLTGRRYPTTTQGQAAARSTGAATNAAEYWALAGTEISPHAPVLRALELRPAPALGFLEMAPTDSTASSSSVAAAKKETASGRTDRRGPSAEAWAGRDL